MTAARPTALLLLGLLAATPALAQGTPPATPAAVATDPMVIAARLFEKYDSNQDGVIDLAEWTARRRSAASFGKIDTNGNNLINRDELLASVRSAMTALPPR